MIGVISKDRQKPPIKEFFELFKTPWETIKESKIYDVIITTDPGTVPPLSSARG